MFARCIAAWLAILLLLACSQVHATEGHESQRGNSHYGEKVVFGADWKYMPFSFLDGRGHPEGFDVELFRHISSRNGWITEFRLQDWKETVELLESGQVDIVPMFVTPDRTKKFLFSEPILRRYHLVFGSKKNKYVSSLKDLEGKRVAVQYASNVWEELTSNVPLARVIPVSAEEEAVLAVADGKADYAILPPSIGYQGIAKHQAFDVVALSGPMLERDYAYAISTLRPELVSKVNAALEQVQVSGKHDELYIKWLANLVPPTESYRSGLMVGAWIALPLLFSTLIVYFWLRKARRNAFLHHHRAQSEAQLRRDAQAQIQYLAFHDPLTTLPNRNALRNTLQTILEKAEQEGGKCALIRLDLVGLEVIETVAGQDLSDKMINLMASRLAARFSDHLVAHIERGKFALVVHPFATGEALEEVMHGLVALVQERFQSEDLSLGLECRLGLAQFPDHGITPPTLMRAAEMACAAAHKQNIRAMVYRPDLEPDPRNLTLLADLRLAIQEGSLGYALQPKLCLVTRKYIGAEMLVRWSHPKHGPLPPGLFVPLAEQTGTIGDMTLYLLRCALGHCREWQDRRLDMSLSVNVSANDLADLAIVDAIAAEAEGIGHRLMLEVTETDVMRDSDQVIESISRLRRQNIRISLDDFGTGHASLIYLQRMAPDELKIDRSFISNVLTSSSDQLIVRTCIQLAHDLGAKVVAEGIEDAETMEWLAAAGCDVAQGFWIARPMPVGDLMHSERLSHL